MKKFALLLWCVSLTLPCLSQINYTANDLVPSFDTPFRVGVNPGYHGQNWGDDDLADIAAGNFNLNIPGAGVKSFRVSLPEEFCLNFGYDVRIDEFNHYGTLGMDEHTVFLERPAPWHADTTYYCEEEPSELFARMYLPIWDDGSDGTPINDDNYAARYVYNVVNTYKDYVKFWEVWNEPDFDYSGNGWKEAGMEGNWFENVPEPCDYKLRAPVYHYIRLLRITYEVTKSIDPDAYVAVGGLGYESFLDVILRHTDNPDGGQISTEFPLKGGAYFDCMSYHCYPHLDGGLRYWSNDVGGFVYTRHSDAAADEVMLHKASFEDLLAQYGYDDVTYPKKVVINTESNIPRKQFGEQFGDNEAQRNFAIKVQVNAYINNLRQLHFYNLADKETFEEASSWTKITGLYRKISDIEPYNVSINDAGIASRTTTLFLWEKTYDAAQTAALNLPDNIRGAAFKNAVGNYVYVIWAATETDLSEEANAVYSFPPEFNVASVSLKHWDFSLTNALDNLPPTNIPLTGAPVFITTTPLPPDAILEVDLIRNLTVSPNPAEAIFSINFYLNQSANIQVDLMDASGKTVQQSTDNQLLSGFQQIEMNIKDLPKGTYFGKLLMENKEVGQFKIIK